RARSVIDSRLAFPTRRSSDLLDDLGVLAGRLGLLERSLRFGLLADEAQDPALVIQRVRAARALLVGLHALERGERVLEALLACGDRKSTRLNSSHQIISYAVL